MNLTLEHYLTSITVLDLKEQTGWKVPKVAEEEKVPEEILGVEEKKELEERTVPEERKVLEGGDKITA